MKYLLINVLFIAVHTVSYAQQYGAEIFYESIQGNDTYKITLNRYADLTGTNYQTVKINLGNGDFIEPVESDSLLLCNGVMKSTYSAVYQYPTFNDTYFISYYDTSYTVNYVNYEISNSIDTLSVGTWLMMNPFFFPNNSCYFLNNPVFEGEVGQDFRANLSAIDSDGDSLSYELREIAWPSNSTYFTPEGFSINAVSGEIEWLNPQTSGTYFFSMLIKDWRTSGQGDPIQTGNISKLFTIRINPDTYNGYFDGLETWETNDSGDYEYRIIKETTLSLSLSYFDSVATSIQLTALGEPFTINNPSEFTTLDITNGVSGTLTWTPQTSQVRGNPYIVVLKTVSEYDTICIENNITLILFVDGVISVNENELGSGVSIYPNPVNNIFKIETVQPDKAEYCIYDVTGRLMEAGSFVKKKEIDVSGFAAGLYVIQLQSNKGIAVKKFEIIR
jgi:hypothetical protein